jgi:hypothetical protein
MPRTTPEPLLSREWLLDYLDITSRTLDVWQYRRTGPPCYRIGRSLKFRKTEVDAWLRTRHETASRAEINPSK